MSALAEQFGVSEEIIEIAKAELLPAAVASAKDMSIDKLHQTRNHFLRVLVEEREDALGTELARMIVIVYAAILEQRMKTGK